MFDLKCVGELLKAIGFNLIGDHSYERDGMIIQIFKKPSFILSGIFVQLGTEKAEGSINLLVPPLYILKEADFNPVISACEVLYSHYKAQ